MELKEQTGDENLYDVMKKKQKRQKKLEKSAAKKSLTENMSKRKNVFEFINKKLKGNKGMLELM